MMSSNVNAIEVRDLRVSYKSLKSFSLKKSILKFRRNKKEVFEALKGVSFDVKKGSVVGIVGKNGSGKSTLLRTVAGIYSPDKGTVNTFGHPVSLLAIGVGFQKNLSGRENIFLTGLLMGFTEKEIRQRINDIIEFSELGEFIDKPVRTYSSGMFSKLAFSITAIMETDIMLIDEVLSVGDSRFKKKSYKKIKELISDKNRTVMIVSHNNETLLKLCTEILWINEGEFVMQGDPVEVIEKYEEFMDNEQAAAKEAKEAAKAAKAAKEKAAKEKAEKEKKAAEQTKKEPASAAKE